VIEPYTMGKKSISALVSISKMLSFRRLHNRWRLTRILLSVVIFSGTEPIGEALGSTFEVVDKLA
jgi:hypothetical protein